MIPKAPFRVSEEQVLWFRARRGHLAGPGADDAAAAVRAVLGAQAQQEGPGLYAVSLRTRGRPSADELQRRLTVAPRVLVRSWGQRDTLHIYAAEDDWAQVVAARSEWVPGGRRGVMPPEEAVDEAGRVLAAADEPLARSDVIPLVPEAYLRAVEEQVAGWGGDVPRFAAGRLLWRLAQRGDACVAHKRGSEQTYAHRSRWFPDLRWPEPLPAGREAAGAFLRRYLAVYGPATPADAAHFFGARVAAVRSWLVALEAAGELIEIESDGRKGLLALADDLELLASDPPRGWSGWPLRLLPTWDTMMMGHADKSWTVANAAEQPAVWRRAAFVAATVVARGRVVATWAHTVARGRVDVAITPLSGWRSSSHLSGVRREAGFLAGHLGLTEAAVRVD